MNIQFLTNDYILAWMLLFKASITEEIQALKEKIYNTYPKKYMAMQKENVEILKYNKDFIPDDDTIYNIIFESEIFLNLKKETEKHRLFLMSSWDKYKKETRNNLKELIRFDIKDSYNILVVHPLLDTVEYIKKNPKKNICWGKKDDTDNSLRCLMRIIFTIIRIELGEKEAKNKEITLAILDLAINNELHTRISKISKYNEGFRNLRVLKRQLYPYWLMYMGADKEELVSYMMRDQIAFDFDKYPIEVGLRKVDLKGFIDFCSNNQKYLIRLDNII